VARCILEVAAECGMLNLKAVECQTPENLVIRIPVYIHNALAG
jgi:hypothetical protein